MITTDYFQYSLVYSCEIVNGIKREDAWILSRKSSLSDETINFLRSKLSAYGVNVNNFLKTNQANCPPIME